MAEKSTRLDNATASVTYVGEAALNADPSVAMWRIRELSTIGTVMIIKWADGNEDYDNVWDDRASLTYL